MNSPIPPFFSRINRTVLVIGVVCLLTTFAGVILVTAQKDENEPQTAGSPQQVVPTSSDPAAKAGIAENFGKLPLSFEINKGQTDPSVKFLSHGPGYDLFLTATEAVLKVRKPRAPQAEKSKEPASAKTEPDALVREGTVLRLKLLGANAAPQVEGQEELEGKVNYFSGNDPAKWQREVPTYRKAYFKDIYPGIDVVYYGNQQELEYDFVLAPRANPRLIRFTIAGADKIRLEKTGRLLLTLKHGEVSLNKPVIYQFSENGSRREVEGGYSVTGNEVRFKLKGFDANKQLIIDPVLSYSTLLGSGGNDTGLGIAVDSTGNAYVTGTTDSTGFPTTPGSFKAISTTSGVFVSKLNAAGTALVYSTYLSGNNFGFTSGNAIAVDASGNAHVTGTTSASDFPIVNGLKTNSNFFRTVDAAASWNNQNSGLVGSVNALSVAPNVPNTIYAATSDGFYRSADGGAVWTKTTSTGFPSFSFGTAIAVHPTNSSLVYAATFSGIFRTTNGGNTWTAINTAPLNFFSVTTIVFDPATPSTIYVGGNGVFKSTDSGATWIAQNNFGISGTPQVRALAIDPTAPLTIYAGTSGNGLFKSTNGGGVWTAMNSGMGGGSPTSINTIAIDPSNTQTVYTGHANSGGINKSTNGAGSWTPLTNGVPASNVQAMVATSSAVYAAVSGSGVIKTINGGTNWTSANNGLWSSFISVLVRHPSNATTLYAGTSTVSSGDAFVTKLNSTGSSLVFSTLLGGSSEESGNDVAVDGTGNIYVAGQTSSLNFPVANAFQAIPAANDFCSNGFVTKINPSVPSFAFSTYLSGNGCDVATSVATDSSGNVYVTGQTSSTNFPTANAFQPNLVGQFNFDSFVTKLTTSGAAIYSTYLGGDGSDQANGITADPSGNAYVTGFTTSTNFPTVNPIQTSNGNFGSQDVFVTKLNSTGSALVYSTYLGGAGTDVGRGIARDSSNNIYLTGYSDSIEFPLVVGALRTRSPMFKSVDGAANWSNDNYGLTSTSITAIAVHPTETSTVYAGTQNGVFKSVNGGRTWVAINNGLDNRFVLELVIDPSTPSTLYVASGGFIGNSGVYKSTDGGNVWNRRVNGMGSTDLIALAIDPVTPNTLYASFFGGTGSRIYKTTNGADDWAVVGNAPPFSPIALVVDPLNHNTLYAGDSASSDNAIFKSTNAGVTWQPIGFAQTGPFARSVSVSPLTAGLVYAETSQGLFKSTNGGTSFSPIPTLRGKVVFDPVSPTTHYLLSVSSFNEPGGVFKSINNGQTWVPMNKGLNLPSASEMAIDPLKPSTLYLGSSPPSGFDAFVTKVNPAGNALIYSTFIGGPLPNNFFSVSAQGFGIAVDPSGNAYVTGLTGSSGFPVTPNSFQPFIRGFQDAFISKLTSSYIISGTVLDTGGLPLSGADVVLNDGTSLTSIATESDGSYQFSRLRDGGNFTVSATKPHFTMAPVSQTFNNLKSDQVLNFTATATNASFFTISGKVSENGVGLGGVTVTLSGTQPGLRVTDSNGNYSFELAGGGNYTVTPSLVGFTFTAPAVTFNSLAASQTANFTANRQSFVVTNTNNHGSGSLRDAITNANATPGTDTIVFNIPGTGVKVISLIIGLPEITDRVSIDATTQPGYAGTPLIELDGTGAGNNANGLEIKAGGSTVRGLAIGNFRGVAISLNGVNNNVIQSNYLGVAANGTTGKQNTRGVQITNSSGNQIGGTTAAARNVISGNNSGGIEINGNSNVIQGNFIGTNAAGTAAVPNSGGAGILILNPTSINNLVGGTAAGARNVISGNQTGVVGNGTGTIIQGNLIGTDVTGTSKIPNSTGVNALGENILVGGLTAAARNIISGNQGEGVLIRGAGSKLQGNYIGTDITGTLALGNGGNGVSAGEALIGGTVPEARNIISANGNFANLALGQNFSGSAAIVQGNYIGTDVTGTKSLGGTASAGINVASNNHQIGGTAAGARNIISGNRIGIQIGGFFSGTVGNVIQGNFIGLNAAGTGLLPNANQGIAITDAVNNTIGGTQTGAGNRIAFNGGPGITLSSAGGGGGSGNRIRGNSIFSNNGLGIDLGSNGVTPNDGNDGDTGPNQLQNFPVLTGVMSSSSSTTITGTLKSIPSTTFQIDFYSNAAVDPSGNGEGAQFFGSASVNTNGSGDATINATIPTALPAGRVLTATATDPNGNTSEFSAANSNAATGSVHFSATSLQVIEDVVNARVTVLRTGGSAGSLSVQFATANGTAIAGQDYTSTSGTLTFAAGETSKTILIPITNDTTTEPDETFTVALNSSNLETIGAPSTLTVTIQDRIAALTLSINSVNVVEGNAGTTQQATFIVSLSAQTSRTVSLDFATSTFNAIAGTSCNGPGVDYITASGSFTFQPGILAFSFPVTICGDSSAEATEGFQILLTNVTGATVLPGQAIGIIIDDDPLELLLEENGPDPSLAAALDARLKLRDPFRILIPDWITGETDRNTRILLFARNLRLDPSESSSAVVVRFVASNFQFFEVAAEDVRPVPNTEFTQVSVRLPNNLPVGPATVLIRVHGRFSNTGTIRIVP